ncbi:MAG: fructosamine kinase family protein [Anaerolineaceae bacterium]|nr:fructosamine kinase family protein [Anaerolineaceae bacterium]
MNALPAALHARLTEVLRQAGDPGPLQEMHPVGGGCIHNAMQVTTPRERYFLKYHPHARPHTFTSEKRGLELLAVTHTVRVPQVLAAGDPSDGMPGFILQEWLAPSGASHTLDQGVLGEQLAALHRAGQAEAYGLDQDNYIGSNPQANDWSDDWVCFFCDRRLRPQMVLAERAGRMPSLRRQRLERLMERLAHWLDGVKRRPSLLHGDLWAGNVMTGPGGGPALIDPAVYYGDREAELAYTSLFGGFRSRFYQAYQAAWPLEPDFEERRDLYNLYHLVNHLNLFGEGYGGEVDAVLQRYVG